MKVFFTTTPRLKVHYKENVEAIFNAIRDLGYTHTSDYLMRVDVDGFYQFNEKRNPVYYDEIVDGLRKADVVVFETSLHSIGVGLLVKMALDLGKGVVALHMKGKFPFLLGGLKDEHLVIEEYTPENIKEVLRVAFDRVTEQMDVRFNFFISPRIGAYLDWVSKNKKLPRAVYLRKLIEEDMAKSGYEPKGIAKKAVKKGKKKN